MQEEKKEITSVVIGILNERGRERGERKREWSRVLPLTAFPFKFSPHYTPQRVPTTPLQHPRWTVHSPLPKPASYPFPLPHHVALTREAFG